MAKITLTTQRGFQVAADAYVYFVEHIFDFARFKPVADAFLPQLELIAKQRGFTGKEGSSLLLNGMSADNRPVYIILLGLGDLNEGSLNIETYRRALGQMVRIIESHKSAVVSLRLPDPALLSVSYERLAQETATVVYQASYHFDDFITNPDRKVYSDFTLSISIRDNNAVEEVQAGVDKGICIGVAVNKSRYWCDLPPRILTPTELARHAQEIATQNGLKITVFDEAAIKKMGMGGIEGVSQGSVEEARLVILEYKAEDINAPTIALVGKGVTFDSGGLSIKPAVSMEAMKDDMSGASVVIATMEVLAQLKPKVNVIALAPLAENMPSGSAIRPGDILTFYNGKTAEVKNTDAEGRLILADALSYAIANYKLEAIIDIATLTGACAHALGPFYSGLMSQHDSLVARIVKASETSGDKVWRLPMDNDYKAAIRSDVSDMCNIGNSKYMAGAITAAFFLQNFVGSVPWAHLDIAGTAFGVPDRSYFRPGATGVGIRLFTDLLMNW
ncbi:leucyl aminopeptidase [Candidatus Dependentiae bacterium]|nr:leucyl aminopeptidase [Candidatus Dependentiae bacterium]